MKADGTTPVAAHADARRNPYSRCQTALEALGFETPDILPGVEGVLA
jgi:hypothetical protein